MSDEAYVQIEIPRTGQKIRNLSLDVLQEDGTTATVLMQVVAIADAAGNPLQLDQAALLAEVVVELRRLRQTIEFKTGVALFD